MYGLLINSSTVCGVRVGMCALWSTQECPAETGLHQCNVGWNLKCLWSIVLWQGFILPWSPPYLLQNASSLRSQLHAAVFLKKRTFIFFFSSFLPPGNTKDVKILRSWNVTPDIVRCSFAVQKCCWNATHGVMPHPRAQWVSPQRKYRVAGLYFLRRCFCLLFQRHIWT